MPINYQARVVVIGGGPAGLKAAEAILAAGYAVDLYDAMPSLGRKFLMAGIGGLNITHSEPFEYFCQRYTQNTQWITPLLHDWGVEQLYEWCNTLGIKTFVGTSGRVFPSEMKAAPLLRAWLAKLRQQGLVVHSRHRWLGWVNDDTDAAPQLVFQHPQGLHQRPYQALVLALGGGQLEETGQ